ncbi:LOW QUALITY PROTEIN: hypothetical protein YC2023_121331 [Brassica napus]
MDEIGIGVSGLNYESDELNKSSKTTKSVQNGGGNKRMPAKNLMAEKRRRWVIGFICLDQLAPRSAK